MTSRKETFTAKWTEPLTNLLVSLLVEEVKKGNRTSSTYNKTGWRNIRTEFNKRTRLQYTQLQLKNKVNKLRKQYGSFKKLLSQYGFGWDSVNKTVSVNDPSIWEHIKDNSEWAKFKKDGFSQYQELCTVFGDTYAIREHAMGTTKDLIVLEENDNDGDQEDLGEHHIDDGAFTPDNIATRTHDKHNVDKTSTGKRRRESIICDVDKTFEALQEMIKSRTSQFASGFVTSQASPSYVDTFSISAVIDVLNNMHELEQDLYSKAVKRACDDAMWREAFIRSPPKRRNGLLQYLK